MKQKKAYLTPEVRLHSMTHGVQLLQNSSVTTLKGMGDPESLDDVGGATLNGMGGPTSLFDDED